MNQPAGIFFFICEFGLFKTIYVHHFFSSFMTVRIQIHKELDTSFVVLFHLQSHTSGWNYNY